MATYLDSALKQFSQDLTAKFKAMTNGDPEDQLKTPIENLLKAWAEGRKLHLVVKGETSIAGMGRPDMGVEVHHLLQGHVELKAPGKGADAQRFKENGHDGKQWERFKDLPNLIYTDGREWALYRNGERVGAILRFPGDPSQDGVKAAGAGDAQGLDDLLNDFTSWQPQAIVPKKPRQLAKFLAPYARLLRGAVEDAVKNPDSEIAGIREALKQLLFPDATDAQFADAYAQTILFGLLLARAQGADVNDLHKAYDAIRSEQTLLDDILEGLTGEGARREIGTALAVVQRVVSAIPPKLMASTENEEDPWLFFYEDFLSEYDQKLRKDAGAYYTPLQVVRCQVRLIDSVIKGELGRKDGFLDNGVSVLDPASGTGTYPLAVLDHAAKDAQRLGAGAVGMAIGSLIQRLYGFEWMVGPYAVTQLRLAQAVRTHGASLPSDGLGVYLTNTLEDPDAPPPALALWGIQKQISKQHERALVVKKQKRILAVLGNPPYDRHAKATDANKAMTGAWVRWGTGKKIEVLATATADGKPTKKKCLRKFVEERAILEDFLEPARKAGHGRHLKNLYNLYVYFIRWAIWKAFEQNPAKDGHGVVSFITASSYLNGDAFCGLREHLRRQCEEVVILDLGGEGQGTHQSDNVFDIKTPVAIFLCWRKNKADKDMPARVRYAHIEGTREEKLQALDGVANLKGLQLEEVGSGWQDAFKPKAQGVFAGWPLLTEVMPWQNNGVKAGRTWVYGCTQEELTRKLILLANASSQEKIGLFKNSPTGKKVSDHPRPLMGGEQRQNSVGTIVPEDVPAIEFGRIGYRSFDRNWVVADSRFLDRSAPSLWLSHSPRQIYLTSLFSQSLDQGPALVACAEIPDLDAFRGSYGAKAVLPLYRDSFATDPNFHPTLLPLLTVTYGFTPTPEDVAAYLYAVLAHSAYQTRHAEALMSKEIRVPFTRSAELFRRAVTLGSRLLWLHTYAERFTALGNCVPQGQAQCLRAPTGAGVDYPDDYGWEENSGMLWIGENVVTRGEFGPVSREVWEFSVSGFKVVQSWLGYRMKNRKGKKSSPLDNIGPTEWTFDFTREFLELLWVLEATVADYPAQAELLTAIEAGPVLLASELPEVQEDRRKPPKAARGTLFGSSDPESDE